MDAQATTGCAACGRATRTIAGRCPRCGAPKTAAAIPPPRRLGTGPGPFAALADWFWSSLSLGAGAILVVLGVLVWSSAIAVVAGALLLLAPLARMVVD